MLNKIVELQINDRSNWGSSKTGLDWRLTNYWGGDSRYFINEKDSKELQSVFRIINDSKNTINKGEKVYVSKASELPRFKLKEFFTNRYRFYFDSLRKTNSSSSN